MRNVIGWFCFGAVVTIGAAGGVSCSDDQMLSQRQFCELVCDRAEQEFPGVLISRVDERGFDYVRGTGDSGRLLVSEEYNYYTRHPELLDELVDRLVSLLDAGERLKSIGRDRDQLHDRIMPVLKPPEFFAEAQARAGGQQLLYGEHGTGLLVFYVLDEPTAISYLTVQSLQGLGLTLPQVNDEALSNLAQRTGEDRYVIERTEFGPIAVGDTRDGFDAARLLSPNLMITLSRVLDTSSFVLSVPRRDLMLIVPSDRGPQIIEELLRRTHSEYSSGPYAISPRLYLFDREGLQRYRHIH